MKRLYIFTITEQRVNEEENGTIDDALKALKNGDLTFEDLKSLAEDSFDYTLDIRVKDENDG